MITYNLENITDKFIDDIMPILEVHRKELQSYDDMGLNPDWDTYIAMDKSENLVNFVARDEDDNIVGYVAYFLSYNMHYSDFLYAQQDVFYVVPDKRGSRIAVNLLKRSEKILKHRGVDTITHHAKAKNNFSQFLQKFGFKETEIMLGKRI